MKINCAHCGKESHKETGHVNRANKNGKKLFCSRQCFYDSRRTSKSEKVEAKRLYDIEYRKRKGEELKVKKKKYYQYNAKEIYARRRAKTDNDEYRNKHAEYCRRPDQRRKERINRYKRRFGKDWMEKTKFCIACEERKFLLEFLASNVFPDGRRHICNTCEDFQKENYNYSTKLTLAAMKSRRYTNLTWEDFAKHPYLIEANKFLILLKQQLK